MAEGTGKTKLITVPADQLKIHPRAQRAIIKTHRDFLINNLDLDAIGVLQGVDYPIRGQEGPWIIDGQHRLLSLQAHDPGDYPVKVLMHIDVKDDARAADLFLKLNNAKVVSTFEKFDKKVIAQDPTALGVTRVLRQFGLQAKPTKGVSGTACCVAALQKIYGEDDGLTLQRVLNISTSSWGTEADATEGKLLEGITLVCRTFNGELNDDSLIHRLSKHTPSSLLGKARSMTQFTKKSVARSMAEVLIGIYNSGKAARKLDLSKKTA